MERSEYPLNGRRRSAGEGNVFLSVNIETGLSLTEWTWWWMWRRNIEGQNTRGWNEAEQLVRPRWCFFGSFADSETQSTRSALEQDSIEVMVRLRAW